MPMMMYNGTPYGGGGSSSVVELTQAEYDALVAAGTVDPETVYFIKDAKSGVTFGSTDISGIGDGTVTGAISELDSRRNVEAIYEFTFSSGVTDYGDSYIYRIGNVIYMKLHATVSAGFSSRLVLATIPAECAPMSMFRFVAAGNTVVNGFLDCHCYGFISGTSITAGDHATATIKEIEIYTSYLSVIHN